MVREPRQRQHRRFPGRSGNRQADADRPDRADRQPLLHHLRAGLIPAGKWPRARDRVPGRQISPSAGIQAHRPWAAMGHTAWANSCRERWLLNLLIFYRARPWLPKAAHGWIPLWRLSRQFLLRQPCQAHALCEPSEIIWPVWSNPILEIGNAQAGIEITGAGKRLSRLIQITT